jgi:glycosyltransferase involved in cell wall biosynthesis
MDKLKLKVSVILPVFNGEITLADTLDSLVGQTFKDFELIACIDGTNDASESILNAYKSKFKELVILKNSINLGLGPTMNRLVANSSGEYIAVAEQDDFYYPNRLKLQVNLLEKRDDIGLVSGIAEFWDGEKVTAKFPGLLVHGKQYPEGEELFLLNYIKQTKIVNSCMMFRKSVHIDNGLYFSQHYPNIPVDWAYFLRFSHISKIYGLHEVLVRLDRRSERKSITSSRKIHYNANKELLRSFFYEFPQIIDKKVYKEALNTQKTLELSSLQGRAFILSFFKFFLTSSYKRQYFDNFIKRLKIKFALFEKKSI